MVISVMYDKKGFFGNWKYLEEDQIEVYGAEALAGALKKCFKSFGNVRSFCFRLIVEGGEMWVVEQSGDDTANSVYTVTHVWGMNSDVPVKMSAAAIRKLARGKLEA